MGTSILKGITMGLLVTVCTLLAVLGTTMAGFEKNIIAYIVDFGLLLSCLAAGYRASKSSGRVLAAGVASGGYAIVGILLLALYFPIDTLGALKIISEGTGLGLLAGILGVGILSSDPDPYDYREGMKYPKRENFYDRKDIYEIIQDVPQDRYKPASSIQGMQVPESPARNVGERSSFMDRRAVGDSISDGRRNRNSATYDNTLEYAQQSESERARIYELCNPRTEQIAEDEAFDWWEIEAKKKLKGR